MNAVNHRSFYNFPTSFMIIFFPGKAPNPSNRSNYSREGEIANL